MDIVDQILERIPSLKPFYEEWMEYLLDDDVTLPSQINLGTKFGNLGIAFKTYADESCFNPNHLKLALDMVEDFVRDADEETQGMVEVRFLEAFWWWATDKEDEASEKYGDYFFECLGPTCLRLVKENKAFWDKLNRERQQEIDEKYAEMQRDYDERKRLGKD
jgi:hypothetical protein